MSFGWSAGDIALAINKFKEKTTKYDRSLGEYCTGRKMKRFPREIQRVSSKAVEGLRVEVI
jgi:hypothetical protein